MNIANQAKVPGGELCREKIWPERTVEEKLEALRRELIRSYKSVKYLQELVTGLQRHTHNKDGQVAVTIDLWRLSLDGSSGPRYIPMSLRLKEGSSTLDEGL